MKQLVEDDDPAGLLASWLAGEPAPRRYGAAPFELLALASDSRLAVSGFSDPPSNLAVSDEVEAWVTASDLDAVTWEWMLEPEGRGNVRLHIAAEFANPVPWGRFLVDLAKHPGPREQHAVWRLVREVLQPRVVR
ncbi:hypothetical protein GB931_09440 [Modestobacter sp. I12A-02628]|uniref:Uncharacterized protein n=1 Tax=Goekera deserti TaxID=2497753 RepID=A0A7K3WLC8_9ACTN|nr:hypothetical protein [Goekera deserti]MPQ98140.1 hypothetical protein [Goekera deserti]NDI48788.1 hypothetical protein [Goekera deserti]NEL56689.1 hypothetical protein [Goekera deserti]